MKKNGAVADLEMGNVADCCSRTNSMLAEATALRGLDSGYGPDSLPLEVNGRLASSGPSMVSTNRETSQKGGNRLLSANGSRDDTHRKYVRMLEERRRNREGTGDSQKGWEMDDTDLIESTLYLDETTAYQGPLTDDETGLPIRDNHK